MKRRKAVITHLAARWPIFGLLVRPAGLSAALAIVNLATTVLIVRLFGEHSYTDFMVDLAIISLALVALEIVPSSYVVFRLQDDKRWESALGPQTILGVVLSLLIVALLAVLVEPFAAFSAWMFCYGVAMAVRRHADLLLQSSGRLSEFFAIELLASALRLPMLVTFIWTDFAPSTALWASLGIGSLLAQGVWLICSRAGMNQITDIARFENWRLLWAERQKYTNYYINTLLKRIRDSLALIVAARLISDKSELAAFLLAYRGVLAATAQVRLVEAVLNHRRTLAEVTKLGLEQRVVLAVGAQLMCLVASSMIVLAAGINDPPWATVAALSALAWPITLMMHERAHAHAAFRASHVTQSLLAYILAVGVGSAVAGHWVNSSALAFAAVIVMADTASWGALVRANRNSL